jgi:hypothetical protein
MDRLEYEGLKRFCKTEMQSRRLKLYFELNSMDKVAEAEGRAVTAIRQSIEAVRREAARRGHSPDADRDREAPPGFAVNRKSTFYNLETGQPTRQWVIVEPEKARNW